MSAASEGTPLDRENWAWSLCQYCKRRRIQVTIDLQPHNRAAGKYESYCWQCYWNVDRWRRGPIINCGPLWDGVDVRRDSRA